MSGIVKWFNDKKGYGFIKSNLNEDIFVHYSSIRKDGYRSLVQDEKVTFELVKTDDGYKAKNVLSIN